ncbi:MAG TPA: DNA polymerase III subunit delta [Candidatus Dormibacteraeota bacterium]|nr:DNA polymerase III subunit delta [Candidatus Dormibacteraeota bacterium]
MIVCLTGENSFALSHELDSLTASFITRYGDLAIERLDGAETDFDLIREALTNLSFITERKLVILRSPGSIKQFSDQISELLAQLPISTDVIILEPKLDKRLAYYKFLKDQTDYRQFLELDPNNLAQWIAKEAKARGGSISLTDARYLLERIGTNQQLVNQELDKLLLYQQAIDRQSIMLLTEATPQSTIFELLESAFGGNPSRTLELYREQRALKVEPPQVIAMLAWQLRILTIIKTAGQRSLDQIAQEAKLKPFVVQKSAHLVKDLSLSQLKQYITKLLALDVRQKSQKFDIDEALQGYLLMLSGL